LHFKLALVAERLTLMDSKEESVSSSLLLLSLMASAAPKDQQEVVETIRSLQQGAANEVLDILLSGDVDRMRSLDKCLLDSFRLAESWSALHVVVACGHREAAEFLCHSGFDPLIEAMPYRCTALDVAFLLRDATKDARPMIDFIV
jgi:hypothetical protein